MATVDITFPDSKRTVTLERVPFTTGSLLRSHYEELEPKPSVPNFVDREGKDLDEPNPNDTKYLIAVRERRQKLDTVVWAAQQLLYAKHLKSEVDIEAVKQAIDDFKTLGIDMTAQIRKEFADYRVNFDDNYMDAYIYLFHVCITNANERNLLTSVMTIGSKESEAAVQEAVKTFRG